MPEWTGDLRDELYGHLARGSLDAIEALILPFKDFKKSFLIPVDGQAVKDFDARLAEDEELQRRLVGMLGSPQPALRDFSNYIVQRVANISAERIAAEFQRRFLETVTELLEGQNRMNLPEWLDYCEIQKGRIVFGSDFNLGVRPIARDFTSQQRKRLLNLIEAIIRHPCAEGIEAVLGMPSFVPLQGSGIREKLKVALDELQRRAEEAEAAKMAQRLAPALDSELLQEWIARGDAGAIEGRAADIVLTDEQIVALFAESATAPPDPLANDELSDTLLGWLERDGALSRIAFEWLGICDPARLQEHILAWMQKQADERRFWEWRRGNKLTYYSLRTYPPSEPPRLDRHFDLLARLFDDRLVAGLKKCYFGRSRTYFIGNYALQELAYALGRRLGPEAARQRLKELERQDSDASWQYRQMREMIEQKQSPAATKMRQAIRPIRALPVAPEQAEINYRAWIAADTQAAWCSNILTFMDDPRFELDTVARLINRLQEDDPHDIELAFGVLIGRADKVAQLGYSLVELTSRALWLPKPTEARAAVDRLLALEELGICTASEAAAALEEAFTIEEPTLWRAAAEAIKTLRKKQPGLAIRDAARIEEILARDPKKFAKYLKPLLDEK